MTLHKTETTPEQVERGLTDADGDVRRVWGSRPETLYAGNPIRRCCPNQRPPLRGWASSCNGA